MDKFTDRIAAGNALAKKLSLYQIPNNTLVAGLVRGGVPVAATLAKKLSLSLDIIIVRKLGLPQQPELAMGAITSDGNYTLNDSIIASAQVSADQLQQVIDEESAEIARRLKLYQCHSWQTEVRNRPVIIVDDGIATGATMLAAVEFMKRQGANPISIAVPVIAQSAIIRFKPLVEQLYYLTILEPYGAVGAWYENFEQVDDEQVCDLLQQNGLIKK